MTEQTSWIPLCLLTSVNMFKVYFAELLQSFTARLNRSAFICAFILHPIVVEGTDPRASLH